ENTSMIIGLKHGKIIEWKPRENVLQTKAIEQDIHLHGLRPASNGFYAFKTHDPYSSKHGDQDIVEYSPVSNDCIRTFKHPEGTSEEIIFDSRSQRLVLISHNGEIIVWDMRGNGQIFNFETDQTAVGISPDARRVVAGSYNHSLIGIENGEKKSFRLESDPEMGGTEIRGIELDDSGTTFICLTANQLRVWDYDDGTCKGIISNLKGLQVQGWDFRGAHHDFSDEETSILRMYGAILNDEDAARWERLMAEDEAFYASLEEDDS
ncbi:MAG: WD40 repeat domain-containing protein, partial [Bacteroidetes bacterium]